MKKLLLVCVLAFAVAGSAQALPNYIWNIGASDAAGGSAGSTATLGQFSPAGTGAQSWTLATSAYAGELIYTGDLGPGLVKSQILKKDFRAVGPDTWIITVFGGASYDKSTIDLRIWANTASNMVPGAGWKVNLLYDPIADAWGKTALGEVPVAATNGTLASPWFKVSLPAVAVADPLAAKAGYILELTTAVEPPIPEPGSMVAVLSGLVGLVGFGIRRRR